MKKLVLILLIALVAIVPTACGGGGVADIDADFQDAMDSYEEFIDQYVVFMKTCNAISGEIDFLAEYDYYMSRYVDLTEDFESWKDEELSLDEWTYYTEVQSRVNEKLAEVIQ